MNQAPAITSRLPVINGLRGIAILAVVYQHTILTGLLGFAQGKQVLGLPAGDLVFKQGWIGVNLFFILSGFVLYLPYFSGKRDFSQSSCVLDFWRRRFSRLMPLFFINCFVCAFVAMRYQPFWFESFLPTITTMSMFSDVQWFPTINPALWSLMIEIYFGLLCPFLVIALDRFGWTKVSLAVFAVALAVRLWGAHTATTCVQNSVIGRLDDFLLGMILCRVYFQNRLRLPNFAILLGGLAALIGGVHLCDIADKLPAWATPFTNNALQLGFFLSALGSLRAGGAIKHVLSSYPLQLMGMMCYSIYIWHLVMVAPLLGQWQSHPIRLLNYAFYLLAFSALSYRYIEFGAERDWKKLFTPPPPSDSVDRFALPPLPIKESEAAAPLAVASRRG